MRPFAFEVRGRSFNQTIEPGEYALGAEYWQLRPTGPQQADLVVAQKSRGTTEHKIFIARLHYRDNRWELRYESRDPRWQQPIRLSPDLTHDADDACEIRIIGYVFGVFRCNPQPVFPF